jgi:hypothetical protein
MIDRLMDGWIDGQTDGLMEYWMVNSVELQVAFTNSETWKLFMSFPN